MKAESCATAPRSWGCCWRACIRQSKKGREEETESPAVRPSFLFEPLIGSPSNTSISRRCGLARRLADNAFYKPVHSQHLAVFQELNTVLARHRPAEYVHLTRIDFR